jgi:hypothetical protein
MRFKGLIINDNTVWHSSAAALTVLGALCGPLSRSTLHATRSDGFEVSSRP